MRYRSSTSFIRRTGNFFIFLSLITFSFVISCNKEKEYNEPIDYSPEIILVKPSTTEIQVGPSEEFLLSILAKSIFLTSA